MLYAIVDIETTGSYAAGSAITEIAIVTHDGHEELHRWETLINPHRHIPRFIQAMTGITDEMVAHAPAFEEVAAQIHSLLQGKIFVAHNVNFDYSFVKHQLEHCGLQYDARKLCTVRMARKILLGYPSYSLGKICLSLGIEHKNHHRAMGDAAATSILFGMLCQKDEAGVIAGMLKGRNKESYLPPHLPVEQVEALPATPGVYYFHNTAGKVVYVGKAVNLQQRVKSHFANNKAGKQKQDFLREISRISYTATATDLMAQILESAEIRKLWPVYNRSQRGYHPKFALLVYEDRQGYKRLALENHKPNLKALHTFNTLLEGQKWLRDLQREFELCPRLCSIATASCEDNSCACYNLPDEYNTTVSDAMKWMQQTLPTMAIVDRGRNEEEQSCILMIEGAFYGMGYLSAYSDAYDFDTIKGQMEQQPDNDFIRMLIYKQASATPYKCVRWDKDGNIIRYGADSKQEFIPLDMIYDD